MIRGFEFVHNRETGLMTVDDTEVEGVDRVVVQDVEIPHSFEVDDKMTVLKFSRPVDAELTTDGQEKRVVISDK